MKEAPPSSPLQPIRTFGPILEGVGKTSLDCSEDRCHRSDDGMRMRTSSLPASSNSDRPSSFWPPLSLRHDFGDLIAVGRLESPAQAKDVEYPRKEMASLSSVHGGRYNLRLRRK